MPLTIESAARKDRTTAQGCQMSRTRRDILDTEAMLSRLVGLLMAQTSTMQFDQCRQDAESLRRISMTLHRWHELECGTDAGAIERGRMRTFVPEEGKAVRRFESDENGTPYWVNHSGDRSTYSPTPDREKGALARLAKIAKRYPSLAFYVQGDPRGCALYVLRPGDVPEGERADSFYSRGLAVHQ
jgi:hypothetical protein